MGKGRAVWKIAKSVAGSSRAGEMHGARVYVDAVRSRSEDFDDVAEVLVVVAELVLAFASCLRTALTRVDGNG